MWKPKMGAHGVNNYDCQNVLYLTGDVNYSWVHLANGQNMISSRTLKWFAGQWPHFVRVHKQTLVNPIYIHDLKRASSTRKPSYVIMSNKANLAISRRQLPRILSSLDQECLSRSSSLINESGNFSHAHPLI